MKVPKPLPRASNGPSMFWSRGGGGIASMMHQGRYADKEYLKFNKNVIDYFMTSSWTKTGKILHKRVRWGQLLPDDCQGLPSRPDQAQEVKGMRPVST